MGNVDVRLELDVRGIHCRVQGVRLGMIHAEQGCSDNVQIERPGIEQARAPNIQLAAFGRILPLVHRDASLKIQFAQLVVHRQTTVGHRQVLNDRYVQCVGRFLGFAGRRG